MAPSTREHLLDVGLALLLGQDYNHLGIQPLLQQAGVPKGSFYHHFESKEDFALQVVDRYMVEVHAGLDACLGDESLPPLARVRRFFELSREKYREQGSLGCLLGGRGQELSGVSERFRLRIEECFAAIASRLAVCFDLAKVAGELPPQTNARELADLLIDCWEGAALRSRLRRNTAPLDTILDFYFEAMSGSALEKTAALAAGPP